MKRRAKKEEEKEEPDAKFMNPPKGHDLMMGIERRKERVVHSFFFSVSPQRSFCEIEVVYDNVSQRNMNKLRGNKCVIRTRYEYKIM